MPLKPREQIADEIKQGPRLLDVLQRIDTAWRAILDERGMGCDCGPPGTGEACDVCEITYLLRLELSPEETDEGETLAEYLDRWEAAVSEGQSTISRAEAVRRWDSRIRGDCEHESPGRTNSNHP